MDDFTWPWEWDWNWPLVAVVAVGLYFLGLVLHLICFPGIIALVVGAIIGALASTYEWFER